MGLSVKVDPIDKDIDIIISETLSPAARSAAFAAFARGQLKDGEEINRNVLGRVPPHKTFVDGSEGQSEDRVKPDGVIQYEFELLGDVLVWIADQLKQHSPVGSAGDAHPGLYKQSHTIFADGNEIPPGAEIPAANEVVFMSMLPYSRKIEQGQSPQAPDGLYQATAVLARQRFGNIAKIQFNYVGVVGGQAINQALAGTYRFKSKPNRKASGIGATIAPGANNQANVRFPAIIVGLNR